MKIKALPPLSFLCLILLIGCNPNSPSSRPLSAWQLIPARDEGESTHRLMIYRALAPSSWIRQDPQPDESIADTTKSVCEFYIREEGQSIRLTIHTFPLIQPHSRIPPQAQIARWKRQFEEMRFPWLYQSRPKLMGALTDSYSKEKAFNRGFSSQSSAGACN